MCWAYGNLHSGRFPRAPLEDFGGRRKKVVGGIVIRRENKLPMILRYVKKHKKTEEEKNFIKQLRTLLRKMPKHLCLLTPHHNGRIHVLRKDCLSHLDKNEEPIATAYDYSAFLAEIKVDAREDKGFW